MYKNVIFVSLFWFFSSGVLEQCEENETMKLPSFKECSLHELKVATTGFSVEYIVSEHGDKAPDVCLQRAAWRWRLLDCCQTFQ